tara:strand:- start:16134 stop:17180 length:1047 start_codon:yes stop_codon:yes gene_type:complete
MKEKTFFNIFVFLIGASIIYSVRDVLAPFLVALFIAYLINPFIDGIQNKLRIKSRGLVISIAMSSITIVLTSIFLICTPIINNEFRRASVLLKEYADIIPPIPDEIHSKMKDFIQSEQTRNFINTSTINEAINKISFVLKTIFSESIGIIKAVLGGGLILLYLIFILLGYPKFKSSWKIWIPAKYREICQEITSDINKSMQSYFRGQAMIALIVGILFSLGFKIIGLPLALILGMFVGTLNLVPYMQILGFIPAIILSLLYSMEINQNPWILLGATCLIFLIVQIIQETILVPKIMNKVTGLHPAIILLSLSIWGSLMGLTGLIIALPISSLLIAYYKRYIAIENQEN